MKTAIETIWTDYTQNKDFSGACLVRTGRTEIFAQAHGHAHKGFMVPNTISTRFDIASVTKTFTAVAVLQLVEAGKLSLSDKITSVINLEGTKIPEDVSIEHLLTHTSGIADDADEEAGEDYADLFKDSPNYAIRCCKDFLKNFAYKDPVFKAGTDVRYNNCAFILLGLAIEELTKVDYRDYIRDHVFLPAGMHNSAFLAMDEVNPNTAEGYFGLYNSDGSLLTWKKNIYSYPPIGTPDGGAYSTVIDLDRFLRAINAGSLLSPEYTSMLLSPQSRFKRESPWTCDKPTSLCMGYAFEFLEIDNQLFSISKDGINAGVGAMMAFYPDLDLSVVILANQDCNIWAMFGELQTAVYSEAR